MCGIAGVIGGHGKDTVQQMVDAMMHRGPDGQEFQITEHYALGHRRLAIIDPLHGKQPMRHPDTGSEIVFNGEIYNFRQLQRRCRGMVSRTNSDTEVLLHLVEQCEGNWEWLQEIEGMFAFAVIRPDGLVLARDPLGIKPLYIGEKDGQFLFASEIKAIATVADRFSEFPPGHVSVTGQKPQPYFTLSDKSPDVGDAQTAAKGLLKRLVRSVNASLTADVPVGVFLSGGLDSSLIAALAKRVRPELESFAVGTPDSSDREQARFVANYLKTKHYEREFTLDEALEALPEIIYALESFDCALVRSAIPNYFLAQLARKRVKVALSGEGADELFAGYDYLKALEESALRQELREITLALHHTNLQRCDRISMARGLEVRVPFLDDIDFVNYAFRIAPELKIHGTQQTEKWILRQVAKPYLPPQIAQRPKVKFAEGTGLGDQLARYAERLIPDSVFQKECEVEEGVFLRSKEELFYFRFFRQLFPTQATVPLLGRSRSL
jgi:asparagine synthase (glutamine-hydrolysing)